MIYSEDIDNLLSGEELCFNNDYVLIECEIEHNTGYKVNWVFMEFTFWL